MLDQRHAPVALPSPGELVDGKYRVERVLGAGAMGVVVAARHEALDQLVAIKFISPATLTERSRTRFRREARAVAALESEHIVRVLDFGVARDDLLYMVMQYLEGATLDAEARARGGTVPFALAVDWCIAAAAGLHVAHRQGVVHRDVKPANLFLAVGKSGDRLVKVLDFGIAKSLTADPEEASLTATDTAIGSPAYMSPEQIRQSRDVDHRTDIWSLGTVLFRLISGRVPFSGAGASGTLASIAADPAPLLSSLNPSVPPSISVAIARCLEKAPGERFSDCLEFARAIAPLASARGALVFERMRLAEPGYASSRKQREAPVAADIRPSFSELETASDQGVAPAPPEGPSGPSERDAPPVAPPPPPPSVHSRAQEKTARDSASPRATEAASVPGGGSSERLRAWTDASVGRVAAPRHRQVWGISAAALLLLAAFAAALRLRGQPLPPPLQLGQIETAPLPAPAAEGVPVLPAPSTPTHLVEPALPQETTNAVAPDPAPPGAKGRPARTPMAPPPTSRPPGTRRAEPPAKPAPTSSAPTLDDGLFDQHR